MRITHGLFGCLLIVTSACSAGAGDEAAEPVSTPTTQAPSPEPSGPDWSITYTGDLTGTVSGSVLVVSTSQMGQVNVNVAARSHDSDAALAATTRHPPGAGVGERAMLLFNVTLEDGNVCSPQTRAPVMASIEDASRDSFNATFSGTLKCEDESVLTIEGFVHKQ